MARPKIAATRSSEAYDRLHQDLIDGTLTPGTKLAIAELQLRYGLGAMPIREALNRLSAEQFVLQHDQRGFSVPPLAEELFLEIQNARIVVETAALRETLSNIDPGWEDRMVLAYHHLAKAFATGPDYMLTAAWAEAHVAFHRALISGCQNHWLLNIASQLYEQSSRYRTRRRQIGASNAPMRENLLEEHQQIMQAAIEGDVECAVSRLIEHYRRSVETVLAAPVELCPDHLRFRRGDQPEDTGRG